jgi:NAD(P)-dependent dehydrogenase (short-subunit alcohol dehydrogenase family)
VSETVPPVSRLLDLTGRVALVTGASGGVGSGIAQRFAEAGAAVVVHYRSDARGATAVVDAVRAAGGRAEAVDAELGDRSSATRLVAAAADHFGGRPERGRPVLVVRRCWPRRSMASRPYMAGASRVRRGT